MTIKTLDSTKRTNGDGTIEVYGEPDMGWYEWRIVDASGCILADSGEHGRYGMQYGSPEAAMRDGTDADAHATAMSDAQAWEAGQRLAMDLDPDEMSFMTGMISAIEEGAPKGVIEQHHFQEAQALMPGLHSHSEAYREGYTYALAWALAGAPPATSERGKDRDCPYGTGYPERDAWFYGWGNGFRHAQREGLLPPD